MSEDKSKPIEVETWEDMHSLVGRLFSEGWDGTFESRTEPDGTRHFLADLWKGNLKVQLQLSPGYIEPPIVSVPAVVVPVNQGEKYLSYTAEEYGELQSVFGSST